MTTQEGSGGTNQTADSSGEEPVNKRDVVAYETHQKLLAEKKKASERAATLEKELQEIKNREAQRETEELERQKNFEKLAQVRDEQLKEAQAKLSAIENERIVAKKLDAFLKTLGGDLPQHYWDLIPIDQIIIDPTTKMVDEMTVAKTVEAYRKTFPETIKVAGGKPNMPSDAPAGNPNSKMDYETWKALPIKDPAKWAAVREGRVTIPK